MICDQVLQLDSDPPGSPGAKFPMPHWIRHVTVMLRFFFLKPEGEIALSKTATSS